ncbi:MAG: ATP-binding protein [Elusimicrobiota bacterium]|nr:ATP-binding protein [Elusimicrobiota bacterium]
MIKRDAAKLLKVYLKTFPVVLIVGPRQCGKTTLARECLKGWKFFDLEKSSDYEAISFDLESFLDANVSATAIDEAQRLPELFPALRVAVDKGRRPGRYVLTGSASPSLLKAAGESLAGRLGVLELTPFGASEVKHLPAGLENRWFFGGYPPVYHLKSARQKSEWLEAYVAAFIEKDIPALGFKIPPQRIRKFLYMLSNVHGGILNVIGLARSMEISQHTAEYYLDLLEGAFIIRRLQPYYANIGKRLVKSPKVYLRDSGLFNYFSGLRAKSELDYFARRGTSWEGLVVEEAARRAALKYTRPGIFYWRTQAGAEVDLILENGLEKTAIEVKLGKTVKSASLLGLKSCMADLKIKSASVIYSGTERVELGGGIKLLPWAHFCADSNAYL